MIGLSAVIHSRIARAYGNLHAGVRDSAHAGWSAQFLEQRIDRKIIRFSASDTGPTISFYAFYGEK